MNGFDVRIHAMRRRPNRPRRPFEVRWHAAGRARSRSFATRAPADSCRAELVRAARLGLEFSQDTSEPTLWTAPEQPATTWLEHAAGYAAVKWPHLAAHSRASLADALATVTPALTPTSPGAPPAGVLRTALYKFAFNPGPRARRRPRYHPDPGLGSAYVAARRPSRRPGPPAASARRIDVPARRQPGRRDHDHT